MLVFCAVRGLILDKRERGSGSVPPSPRLVLCVLCVVVVLWIVVLCSSQTQNCTAGLEGLVGATTTGLDRVLSFLLSSLFFSAQTHAGTDRHANFRQARSTAGLLDLHPYLILRFLRVCVPACRRRLEVSSVTLRRCRASVRSRGSSPLYCGNPPAVRYSTVQGWAGGCAHSTVSALMAAPSAIQLACARKKSISA